MLPYANPELFRNDSVTKSLIITYTGGQFTNSDLLSESFEMTESINSDEQVQFGECSSTMVKFQTFANNIHESMVGKVLTVTITPNGGNPVPLGTFKVGSDEPSADLKIRTITAYDAISDIFNTELATWYEGLFPNEGDTLTCKQFRDSLFTYLGIEQESVSLINDSVVIEKTVTTNSLSGKDVLYCICQLNGVFGKIGRDGKFKYLSLNPIGEEALYPSETLYPADDLYPYDGREGTIPEEIPTGTYISCQYENYETELIDKVQIRMEENDIGCIVGSGTNAFIIENNFLLFGKSTEDLTPIAQAIYDKISGVMFRPSTMILVGNPLREIGDGIRLVTKYVTIDTYVLSRKLKGIQSLQDEIQAKSTKERDESLTDTHHELMQLLGKSNLLERTIEETQSTITDIAEGLQTQITQNAEAITGKASKEDGSTGFAYKLTAEKFQLITQQEGQQPTVVFSCDKNGISVIGSTSTTVIKAASADIFSLKTSSLETSTLKLGNYYVSASYGVDSASENVITGGVLTYKADLGGYIITGLPQVKTISFVKYSSYSNTKLLQQIQI